MSIELTIAFVGFVGVVIGGLVQGIATTLNERWKYRVEMRTEAYKSLMESVINLSVYTGALQKAALEPTAEQVSQILIYQAQMATAQSKIALYGSRKVLAEVSEFFSKSAALREDADYESFIDFVSAMRDDSYANRYPEFRKHLDDMMLRGAIKG